MDKKIFTVLHSKFLCNWTYEAHPKTSFVSGHPTDPNILGPAQTFLKPYGILKSILRLFLGFLYLFHTKKFLLKKKKAFLLTLKILET